MHELSLCGAIIDTVAEHAGSRRIERINLTVGHFRQVVPETLSFCWDMRVKDTELEGCELVINAVPAVIVCAACNESTRLIHPILRCGSCDSIDVTMTSGEEFLIESIDLAPAASSPT